MYDQYENDIEDYEDIDDGVKVLLGKRQFDSLCVPTLHAEIVKDESGEVLVVLYQNPSDNIVMSRNQFLRLMTLFLHTEVR